MRRWRAMAGSGLAALAVHAHAASARPAQTACRIENGVLVIPAQAAGLTGQFILDTGAARSILDATQASEAGIGTPEASTPIRLADRRLAGVEMTVAALDARTRAQPTPITGVLGADVLQGQVLEVRTDPCRLRLGGRPSPGRVLADLPVELRDGVPYVRASLSDGTKAGRGLFRVSTGADLAVRLSPRIARLEGAPPQAKDVTTPLRALSLGDVLVEQPTAAVADDEQAGVAGEIGEPVWAARGMRLDLRRHQLVLFDPPAVTPVGRLARPSRHRPAGPAQ